MFEWLKATDILLNLPKSSSIDDTNDKLEYKAALISRLRLAYDNLVSKRDAEIVKYKANYDKRQRKVEFKEGDQVMYFRSVPKQGLSQKLLPRWEGPFQVINRLGPVSYRIEREQRNLVAHVQKIRLYKPYSGSQSL